MISLVTTITRARVRTGCEASRSGAGRGQASPPPLLLCMEQGQHTSLVRDATSAIWPIFDVAWAYERVASKRTSENTTSSKYLGDKPGSGPCSRPRASGEKRHSAPRDAYRLRPSFRDVRITPITASKYNVPASSTLVITVLVPRTSPSRNLFTASSSR